MVLSTYFTTVYNAESSFTIYCKIYNDALRTLTIFYKIDNASLNVLSNTAKYANADAYIVAPRCWIHIAYMHNDMLDASSYSYFSNKRR